MIQRSDLSTRTWFVLIALGFLLLRVVPLYLLDRTELSAEKRAQDPFTRNVRVASRGEGTQEETNDDSPASSRTELRVPAEHLASYLMANLAGGLKQLATTSLWVKYDRLKEKERYNEAVALLELLKVLQPDREAAWSYLAWDIAFNISSYQPSDEKMWEKVKKAAGIARDGNQRMGGSLELLFELSWIYGFRVPQEPYMMNQTWQERGRTNYDIAVEHLNTFRKLARERNEFDGPALRKSGFLITFSFSDLIMLLHYDEHDTALNRISRYKTLAESLFSDYRERNQQIPDPYRIRHRSYRDLPAVINVDRSLSAVPRKRRKRKIERTKKFLTAWKQFFHTYRGALAEEAVRHVLRQSFELLYYVSRDLKKFHQTGDEKYRERASTLLRDVLGRVEHLTPEQGQMGGGYARNAHDELGTFWQQMNRMFEHLEALKQAGSEQEKENIRRDLEDVYARLLNLYRSTHRGFHMDWFKQEIEHLESKDILNY